jgi:hypothetical protein
MNKYSFVCNNPLKYIDIRGTSKHHYYVKHENFDAYFYHDRINELNKGADISIIAGQPILHYGNRQAFKSFENYTEKILEKLNDILNNTQTVIGIIDIGIGLFEIGSGIAGTGSALALEIGTVGVGTAIAIPATAGSLALIADGAIKVGTGIALFKKKSDNKYYNEIDERKEPGKDGAISKHIIEKYKGKTNSVTHQVKRNGKIIHQHQKHIGKYGSEKRFPDKWVEYPTIDEG